MTPTKESHAWSWETSRSMFLQAADQESAMGDVIQRLYSIAPRESEDYKSFVSRIRELLRQISNGDNHNDLIVRIDTKISNEGRAKVNSPYDPRSSGYRPSPQIQTDARHKFSSATQAGNTAKLGGNRMFKRPRSDVSRNGAKNTNHSSTPNSVSIPSPGQLNNKFCHFCKKPGHEKEDCFKLRKKLEAQTAAAVAGFPGKSEQNAGLNRTFGTGNYQKHVKFNMVAYATPLKRARSVDDHDDLYGRSTSGPVEHILLTEVAPQTLEDPREIGGGIG
ncbi:hypothetical protein BGX24_006683 [Mortierella sp. AD032]|nr:hypothetical protein BGX24_006683 [Mortierella sp. AD032]